MADAYYVLNQNEGMDTVHRNPREECNTQADEMPGRQVIDGETADALLALGQAKVCRHCFKPHPDAA